MMSLISPYKKVGSQEFSPDRVKPRVQASFSEPVWV